MFIIKSTWTHKSAPCSNEVDVYVDDANFKALVIYLNLFNDLLKTRSDLYKIFINTFLPFRLNDSVTNRFLKIIYIDSTL